ncbi:MAG: hypothetical protein PHR00_00720 [Patescibacteria group bacterium]|nr:hypothetical protein [Patescibacteria group bacterium]
MPILQLANSSGESKPLAMTVGAKKIFQAVYWDQSGSSVDDDAPRIHVSDMVSKMAFYYEKLRNSVDYREESLMRKEAIVRILRRLIIIENALVGASIEPEKVSKNLLIELIRAAYLQNNKLPEEKITELAVIINKYLVLRAEIFERLDQGKQSFSFVINSQKQAQSKKKKEDLDDKSAVNNWIIGLAASEIEENLSYNQATDTTVSVMYDVLLRNVKLPPELPYERDLSIQIYLGILRNYLNLDDDEILSYVLFKYFNEDWNDPTAETIDRIVDRLDELKSAIDSQLEHPLTPQLNRIVHQYTVYFTVIHEVISSDPKKIYEEISTNYKSFMRRIQTMIDKKTTSAKKKLWKNAVRSIIYIFLTKSVLVVLLEVPANRYFGEVASPVALSINVFFPALILFMSVAFTRLPGQKNADKIMSGVEEVMFADKVRKQPIVLKTPSKRNSVMSFIFTVIYVATFVLVFGAIIKGLRIINFSWVSIIIFLFFLAFVSFFVIRIRRGPKYWVVIDSRENIFTLLWSFVSVPIASTGKFLSGKFQKINVFIFILDFIIEAPFKVLVTVTEEWTKYLKERRDNLS